MSLAAFKRRIREGQRVTVVNNLHPTLSGERTVHKVRSRDLITLANGVKDPWHAPWPRSGQWRIQGDTLHWIEPVTAKLPDGVAFSYTFHFGDEKPQAPGEPTATMDATETPGEPEKLLVAYRVSWEITGKNLPGRSTTVVVDETEIRSGDWDARLTAMRKMLANRFLPLDAMDPGSITILDAHPLCNCEPFPTPENCAYAEHKGHRFHLASSSQPGFEVIRDRHRDKILGTVGITLSVEFLTLVQRKYGHQ